MLHRPYISTQCVLPLLTDCEAPCICCSVSELVCHYFSTSMALTCYVPQVNHFHDWHIDVHVHKIKSLACPCNTNAAQRGVKAVEQRVLCINHRFPSQNYGTLGCCLARNCVGPLNEDMISLRDFWLIPILILLSVDPTFCSILIGKHLNQCITPTSCHFKGLGCYCLLFLVISHKKTETCYVLPSIS